MGVMVAALGATAAGASTCTGSARTEVARAARAQARVLLSWAFILIGLLDRTGVCYVGLFAVVVPWLGEREEEDADLDGTVGRRGGKQEWL